jgi:hypothetical protein
MLSGETAYGRFPHKTVSVQSTVALRTELSMMRYQVRGSAAPSLAFPCLLAWRRGLGRAGGAGITSVTGPRRAACARLRAKVAHECLSARGLPSQRTAPPLAFHVSFNARPSCNPGVPGNTPVRLRGGAAHRLAGAAQPVRLITCRPPFRWARRACRRRPQPPSASPCGAWARSRTHPAARWRPGPPPGAPTPTPTRL